MSRVREAKVKGYEGDSCPECGNFTMVRNGTCLKCVTCGATAAAPDDSCRLLGARLL